MTKLRLLEREDVIKHSVLISQTLQKAVDAVDSPGWDGIDFIINTLKDPDTYSIWELSQNKKVVCYFATMIVEYPNYKAVSITTLAAVGEGTNLLKVFISLMPEFESQARAIGCKFIEVIGRQGWGRLFKDYKIKSTTFIKGI